MKPGPRNTLTDVAGIRVGNAHDSTIKSGVTVILPDQPATAAVKVLGGAPGTRETELLAPDKTVKDVHAIVLSGGSAFGLDAGAGVMDALAADGIGYPVGPARVPIVPAAILFDLLNGGDKNWPANPYRQLGAKAYRNAGQDCQLGTIGAGTGAIAGRLKGALGTASLVLPSGFTVGAVVACNALGNAACKSGAFFAAPFEIGDEFGARGPAQATIEETFENKISAMENTTIAVVATDAQLSKPECQRIAVAAHDGLARAVVPAHTPMDGDLVFAMSTRQKPVKEPEKDILELGHAAAICLSRAIARGIYHATPAKGDVVSTWASLYGSAT